MKRQKWMNLLVLEKIINESKKNTNQSGAFDCNDNKNRSLNYVMKTN